MPAVDPTAPKKDFDEEPEIKLFTYVEAVLHGALYLVGQTARTAYTFTAKPDLLWDAEPWRPGTVPRGYVAPLTFLLCAYVVLFSVAAHALPPDAHASAVLQGLRDLDERKLGMVLLPRVAAVAGTALAVTLLTRGHLTFAKSLALSAYSAGVQTFALGLLVPVLVRPDDGASAARYGVYVAANAAFGAVVLKTVHAYLSLLRRELSAGWLRAFGLTAASLALAAVAGFVGPRLLHQTAHRARPVPAVAAPAPGPRDATTATSGAATDAAAPSDGAAGGEDAGARVADTIDEAAVVDDAGVSAPEPRRHRRRREP